MLLTSTNNEQQTYTLNHQPSLSAEQLIGVNVQGADPFGLTTRPLLALLFIFLAGLGLAFTPCILPMLPIVANIVARQEKPSAKRSFLLSASYGVGVATAYGILGVLIAYLGASIGLLGLLQNPFVLTGFALIFVVLGLYMLELINIRLPYFISQRLNYISQVGNNKLGSIGGSFIVGLLSALVVSPCVSAPLSGVLIAVSSIGNMALGFAALFALGIGLSLPLVVFATTEGNLLPKAGEWMNTVKKGFAYLMFAVALMMIERVVESPIVLALWASWFLLMAWWLLKLSNYIRSAIKFVLYSLLLLSVALASVLFFGAMQGNTNSLSPLSKNEQDNTINTEVVAVKQLAGTVATDKNGYNNFIKITTLSELDDILAVEQKVVVDIMADWCIECKIMDRDIFDSPPPQLYSTIKKASSQVVDPQDINFQDTDSEKDTTQKPIYEDNWQLVKLDITETTAESRAILKRYELVGPPTLLYYTQGQLLTKQVGETSRANFIGILETLDAR